MEKIVSIADTLRQFPEDRDFLQAYKTADANTQQAIRILLGLEGLEGKPQAARVIERAKIQILRADGSTHF